MNPMNSSPEQVADKMAAEMRRKLQHSTPEELVVEI
jgi:hypothetical protein